MSRAHLVGAALAVLASGPGADLAQAAAASAASPRAVVAANAAAHMQAPPELVQGAAHRFTWTEGGLYQVYAAPGRVSDLVLQPGEQLAGPGPIAAGDTARWILGDTESGIGDQRRVHVLVKPTAAGLTTNLVINTDRRTYYVELRATTASYMASVAWLYPSDALIAVRKPVAPVPPMPAASPPVAPPPLDPATLNFGYRLDGDHPRWRPTQVFDDGARVVIVFPDSVSTGEMPPLFLLDAAGRAELVNYRLVGRRMVVDRLFDRAELRLGDKRSKRRVRITRVGPIP